MISMLYNFNAELFLFIYFLFQFVANCLVWDIAAGDSHSLFLTDSGGFHPDVYYSGKHPR